MKTYDKAGTCIKCGYGGIEDNHRDKESQGNCDLVNKFNTPARDPIPEHIARTCKNCGYSWDEGPMDGVDVGEFIDAIVDGLAKDIGIPKEELIKPFPP